MAATMPMEVGGDLWNARVYASLSAASELAAEFDRPDGAAAPSAEAEEARQYLNRLNDLLARDLSLIDSLQVAPTGISKEKLIAVRDSFSDLYRICQRILQFAKSIALTTQMVDELELLSNQSERLFDVVDWLDALSTPEEINAIFQTAAIERANGDLVPWSEVQ